MKPDEFWNCEFKQMTLYCECNIIKTNEDFKTNIILHESVTNKMIQADPLGNKKPKIIPLKKTFEKLFKK